VAPLVSVTVSVPIMDNDHLRENQYINNFHEKVLNLTRARRSHQRHHLPPYIPIFRENQLILYSTTIISNLLRSLKQITYFPTIFFTINDTYYTSKSQQHFTTCSELVGLLPFLLSGHEVTLCFVPTCQNDSH
jgi:hypothetical protein